MNSPEQEKFTFTNLDDFPDVALEYGLYMAAFSYMENQLYMVFTMMLGGTRDRQMAKAQAILGHIQSFSVKLDTIANYLPFAQVPEKEQALIGDIIGIARACNSFRNSLAHGLFCLIEGRLHIFPYAFESKKSDPVAISSAMISEHRHCDVERANLFLECLLLFGDDPPDRTPRLPSIVRKKFRLKPSSQTQASKNPKRPTSRQSSRA